MHATEADHKIKVATNLTFSIENPITLIMLLFKLNLNVNCTARYTKKNAMQRNTEQNREQCKAEIMQQKI